MQLHCHLYRSQLRAMLSRHSRSATNSQKYVNNKFLSTSQKQTKIQNLKCRVYAAERKVQKLCERIDQITILNGVEISDPGFKDDLVTIMGSSDSEVKCAFPEGSFRRLFWEQQLKASSVTDSRQMRRHPFMIRWCLNLKLLSSSAYHSLRTSGFIKLPSERTMRDYTHL